MHLKVIVVSPFHPEWLNATRALLMQGLSMGKGHNLIMGTMNDEYRTVDPINLFNILKRVTAHCPAALGT